MTIPLADYLNLIKPKETISLTTIESAVLTGEFGEKLRLKVSGTSVGQAVPQPLLSNNSQFMISKCTGTANIVNKDQMISVLAKEKAFHVECDLSVKSWGELVFNFSDVLFIGSEIQGAESSIEGPKVLVHRKLKDLTGAAAEVTVVGRYQISVLPESTKFSYFFEIHNPNRGKKAYQLSMVNGESVTKIQTAVEYKEIEDGKISLNLNPGDNRVEIYGALADSKWHAPVASAMQYLMIQNNPMLQLKIETTAKRISNEDSRMPASFSSSRTYLLDSQSNFSWDVKKLEVIASTGYSVGQASYHLYVPDEGPGIVEAQFVVENRGTPELALNVSGEPVYLEIDSQPQVLAKDDKGYLLAQIPNGDHQVVVQYKTKNPFNGWIADINEMMVRPSTTLSNVSINVGFSKSWSALFGTVLTDYFNHITWINFFVGLLAVLLVMSLLKNLALKKADRTILLFLTFIIHILKPAFFYLTFLTVMALIFTHHRNSIGGYFSRKSMWQKSLYTFGAVAFVMFLYRVGDDYEFVGLNSSINSLSDTSRALSLNYSTKRKSGFTENSEGSYAGRRVSGREPVAAITGAGSETFGAAASQEDDGTISEMGHSENESTGDFKGLPAKIRIPAAEHNLSFTQGLVDNKINPNVHLFALNANILNILEWTCALLFLLVVFRKRKQFTEYLRF